MILKEKFKPTVEEKDAVKKIVETIKGATGDELIGIVIKAVSEQAAASVVLEAAIERFKELGVKPGDVAGIVFEGGEW